jgi:predicted ATP-binding protein involved in virulence
MYLKQVHLKNIRCFDELYIDFTQPNKDTPCRWVVLLGENGAGKSTFLQMIALALLGRDMIYEIASGIDWVSYVRESEIKGRIEITLLATSADKRRRRIDRGYQSDYHAAFELGRTIRTGLRQDNEISVEDFEKLDETLYADKLTGGWFACGYGPWRRLPRPKSSARSGRALATSGRKPYRFSTMFDEESALTLVNDWLVDLDYRQLKERETGVEDQLAKRSFDVAIQAIEKALPGIKFKSITSEGDVIFEENGVDVSVNHLSDGYRGTMAWIGDLVRRLVDAFPHMENPLKAQGVVLVDELDIHLHPKWQRSIVDQTRDLFPELQFIVASHSPFVAQDMSPEDKIIVLKREGDRIIPQEDISSVKGWRVDQILTSYLFDLETTRDVSIAVAEQEYQRLLDLQTTGRFTARDRKRLKELKKWLREHQSPPGETPEENEVYDAAQSLIDILDEYLAR